MNRFVHLILAAFLALAVVAPVQHAPVFTADSAWAAQEKASKKTLQKSADNKQQATKTAVASKKKAAVPVDGYKGAIVYDLNAKTTLFSNKADRQIPPASLTKVLAMYVAMDMIRERKIPMTSRVAISEKAATTGGSRMGLDRGDIVTLHDLLRGMAICSGNDATVAVAEFLGKTEQNYVNAMNRKARAIGMSKSTFKNAHGLPAKGQFTTARDMLTLSRSYLAAYPANLATYHNSQTMTYKGAVRTNANTLLKNFAGADGLKTGYVTAAGYNLISTAKREDVRLITVLLGAPSRAVREKESSQLLEKGFEKHATLYGKAGVESRAATGKKAASEKKAPAGNKAVKGAKQSTPASAKVAASGTTKATKTTVTAKKSTGKTAQAQPEKPSNNTAKVAASNTNKAAPQNRAASPKVPAKPSAQQKAQKSSGVQVASTK